MDSQKEKSRNDEDGKFPGRPWGEIVERGSKPISKERSKIYVKKVPRLRLPGQSEPPNT